MKPFHKAAKNMDNFETYLIRIIVIILVVLIACATAVYYLNLKATYTSQIKKNNDSLTEQIAISYETIMRNITDSVYKVPLYDYDLIDLVQNHSNDSVYKIQLFKRLSSIVFGNQYLLSAYLYDPKYDIVYNSDTGTMNSLSAFSDQNAFKGKEMDRIYTITDPRLVSTSIGNRLLMSVVLPLPLSSAAPNAVLIVNIDASKLYNDIMKRIRTQDSMELFVYNTDKSILISKDDSLLFTSFDQNMLKNDKTSRSVTSYYYSDTLKWNFVLRTTIKNPNIYFTDFYSFTTCLLLVFFLGLITIILLIRRFSKPMHKIISNYNDSIWREYLTGGSIDSAAIQTQVAAEGLNAIQSSCSVLLLQYLKTQSQRNNAHTLEKHLKSTLDTASYNCKAKVVAIDSSLIALVLFFKENPSPEEHLEEVLLLCNAILNTFDEAVQKSIYIGAGLCKDSFTMVPISYREASEALNYKIESGSKIITYETVMNRVMCYEYPYEIEKQLVNNILAGNMADIEKYIDKFFSTLGNGQCMQDSEIRNIIYQLETSILRAISNLPIPIKIDSSFNIPDLLDLHSIREDLTCFAVKIVAEISRRNQTDYIICKILDHIDKRFGDEDFNLNIAADELNVNRNYLAKVVREQTDETFNDYLNHKRIGAAKQLIVTGSYTIEEIAHKVGFNYAHYFIKVFKNMEGITPGQYRERCRREIS